MFRRLLLINRNMTLPLRELLGLFNLLLFIRRPRHFLCTRTVLRRTTRDIRPRYVLQTRPTMTIFRPLRLRRTSLFMVPSLTLKRANRIKGFSSVVTLFIFTRHTSSLPQDHATQRQFLYNFFTDSVMACFLWGTGERTLSRQGGPTFSVFVSRLLALRPSAYPTHNPTSNACRYSRQKSK